MDRFTRRRAAAGLVGLAGIMAAGCASPLDTHTTIQPHNLSTAPGMPDAAPRLSRDTGDAAPTLDDGTTLASYQRFAAINNRGLDAAFQRWRATAERVPQARALPDPRLTLGAYIQEVETAAGPMNSKIGISQRFPWWGTLRHRESAAIRDARAAWRRLESERLALAQRVTTALWELEYLRQATQIASDNMTLLHQFEQTARARYRATAQGHPDLFKLQVELGLLEDRIERLAAQRQPLEAILNAALGRPVGTEVPATFDLPGRVFTGDIDDLIPLLDASNPALAALDEQIERERSAESLAKLAGLPEITIGIDYTLVGDNSPNPSFADRGKDPVMLMLSLNLPLNREKYNAGVRAAVARRLSLAHTREDQSGRLQAAARTALFMHQDANRRLEWYENSLIPKATDSMLSALGSFRTGEADFFDLLEAQRALLEFSLTVERSRADRATALAKLEQLVGADLPTDHPTPAPREEVSP